MPHNKPPTLLSRQLSSFLLFYHLHFTISCSALYCCCLLLLCIVTTHKLISLGRDCRNWSSSNDAPQEHRTQTMSADVIRETRRVVNVDDDDNDDDYYMNSVLIVSIFESRQCNHCKRDEVRDSSSSRPPLKYYSIAPPTRLWRTSGMVGDDEDEEANNVMTKRKIRISIIYYKFCWREILVLTRSPWFPIQISWPDSPSSHRITTIINIFSFITIIK